MSVFVVVSEVQYEKRRGSVAKKNTPADADCCSLFFDGLLIAIDSQYYGNKLFNYVCLDCELDSAQA